MNKKCIDCNCSVDLKKSRCICCDKKRRAEIYKKSFEKRVRLGKRHITAICTRCGTDYNRDKYSKGAPFCGPTCKGKYRYEQKQKLRNLQFDSGDLKYRGRIRTILLERYGNICQICKHKKWTGKPIPLQVDHIDGNAANNSPDNLRMICHNCDALLPTFAGKNRGSGRKSKGLKSYE